MGIIRQTKRSANQYWTDILYQAKLNSGPASALELLQDQAPVDQQNVLVQEGKPFWIKWLVLYQDQMDFSYYANGLYSLPNSLSNYTVYQPDGVTTIDLSSSQIYPIPQGSGQDPLEREGQWLFINYLFQPGQTYYLSFIPIISGPVGLYVEGD